MIKYMSKTLIFSVFINIISCIFSQFTKNDYVFYVYAISFVYLVCCALYILMMHIIKQKNMTIYVFTNINI